MVDELDKVGYREFFNFLKGASQIELYFVLVALGELRHILSKAYYHDGTLPYQSFYDSTEEAFLKQNAIAKELVRFGINAVSEDGKSPSAEYWTWFNRFDTYVKGLTEKQYKKLEARINSKESTMDVIP
jgi:hypothetical protein